MSQKNKRKLLLTCNIVLACIVVAAGLIWWQQNTGKKAVPVDKTENIREIASAASDAKQMQSIEGEENNAEDALNTESGTASDETTGSETEGDTGAGEAASGNVKTLTLSMVGDVLLHSPVSKSGLQKNGKYNYDHLFRHVKSEVETYDVAMLNEEVLLAGPKFGITGYPKFNGRFEVGDAIEKAGFDVILHATNHSMDQGRAGLISDLKHWKKAHPKLKVTGMYLTKKASKKITYVKKNGIKIAILNYTYGTNGLPLPSDMPFAVNLMTKAKVKRDVKLAKKNADFVVVCPHWGTEYFTGISSYQKEWTNYFAKLKVDLVIGAHPHVIGPVKWVKGKNGHRMLVYYSLGNYINSTSRRGAGVYRQYLGGMADVTIEKTEDGKTQIKEAAFLPLITHYSQSGKMSTYFMKDYTAKQAKKSRVSQHDKTFTYAGAKAFFKKIVSEKFLRDI